MFKTLFKLVSRTSLGGLRTEVEAINRLESEIKECSDEALKEESTKLKTRVREGESLDAVLPRAFALVREASRRTLGQRQFDVQLMGGIVLHKGAVAEMVTGEGKTLAAVAPTYLNALSGEGAHVVTVNEYLARRDAVWMGQIYRALGMNVACLVPNAAFLYDPEWHVKPEGEKLIDKERDTTGSFLVQQEFLRPISRREAYLADVTYGTNHEFGFDYLRDNLAYRFSDRVQRGHPYAIIDEVDSILIDEARTPLIIAAPDAKSSEFYKTFAKIADHLIAEEDYTVDEKKRTAHITEAGIEKVEKMIGVHNLYAPEHLRLVHYMEESLRAKAIYRKDRDYVVKNDEVIIVDEFTGRMLHGRRYNGGLHQAIEAKEGVFVKEESRTYAKISIQNYFRMYKKISGMTGTAQTSAEEFHKVYKLDVVSIPTHRSLVRKDEPDLIYKNAEARWQAVAKEVKDRHEKGQPVLLGTTSIEKNELASAYLSNAGVPHEVLNAKNNEREGAIIAQAGRLGGVTVATNVAGRGVDIILGGNPPTPEEAQKVRDLGGLYVLGTERHEARRIDNQLRGRAGRQGDPGSTQFFLSLEDDLLRIFGGERIKNMMDRFDIPDDQPIQVGMVSKAVAQAQSKVEGANFDLRKHLLEYDDVLNMQRTAVYKRRQEILESMEHERLAEIIRDAAFAHAENLLKSFDMRPPEAEALNLGEEMKKLFAETGITNGEHQFLGTFGELSLEEQVTSLADLIAARSREVVRDPQTLGRTLSILDLLWMNNLEDLEALSESVGLRAYGHKDPLVEYRRESHRLFLSFWDNFNAWVFSNIFKLANNQSPIANREKSSSGYTPAASGSKVGLPADLSAGALAEAEALAKVGRNDPCPCGAVNPATGQVYKYKKCGLINAPHHKG